MGNVYRTQFSVLSEIASSLTLFAPRNDMLLLLYHLQLHTRSLVLAHLLGDLHNERATFERIRTTVLKNIAYHIPVGIGVAVFGFIAHVRAHRLGAAQTRTFADEQDHYIRLDQFANIVHHAHTCIFDKEWRTECQSRRLHALSDDREYLSQVGLDCRGGESIANHQLNIDVLLALLIDYTFGIVIK